MSPHQRVFSLEASAVKSRRILSALAAAAGSGTVVFFHRLAARPRRPRPASGGPPACGNAAGPAREAAREPAERHSVPSTPRARS